MLQRILIENTHTIVMQVSIFCLSISNKTTSMNEQTFDNSRDNGNSLSRSDSSNMILAEECPGFKYYIPATRTRTGEPQNIHESIKEGPPSEGFHKDFYWIVKVGDPSGETREPIQVTADLSVDDLGEFSMGPLKISLPEQGPNGGSSGQSDSASGKLPPGFYCATLSYDNIDYKKNANKAFLEFSLNASPGKAVPEDNEDNAGDCERDDCDCQKGAQNENTTQPGGEEGALLLGKSARQNGPVLPAVKISQLPLARTTCFGRRISVPSEAWEAYREACLKLRPKIFQKRLGQSTLLPTIIRWQVVWRNHPAPAISASPTPW